MDQLLLRDRDWDWDFTNLLYEIETETETLEGLFSRSRLRLWKVYFRDRDWDSGNPETLERFETRRDSRLSLVCTQCGIVRKEQIVAKQTDAHSLSASTVCQPENTLPTIIPSMCSNKISSLLKANAIKKLQSFILLPLCFCFSSLSPFCQTMEPHWLHFLLVG